MSNLKKIDQELVKAPSVKAALQLDFVRDAFVRNYEASTGHKDGNNRFASELFHYLDLVNENDDLKDADRFSHMAAIVKAGQTGLSFAVEGHLYPIPYGKGEKKVVKVQIGAHGKRELLRRMPTVKIINESQLVLKGDTFKHDKLNNKIVEHITSEKQPPVTLDVVVASYCRLEFVDGSVKDVVVYHEDLVKAKATSKDNQRENAMWNKWVGQACKKVPYQRAYKLYYRQPQIEVTGVVGFTPDEEDEEETVDVGHQEQATPEAVQTDPPKEAKKPKEKVEEAKVVSKNDQDLDKFLEDN